MLSQVKLWLIAGGTALLAGLAVIAKVLKAQRDSAREAVDTLKGTIKAEKKTKEVVKKEKERLVSRRADLKKEIEKDDEDFEGLDNLRDPNDY